MLCILLWWRHPVESADPGIHIGLQRFGLLLEHFQKQIHLYCNQRTWNTSFHKHGRISLHSYGSCVYGQPWVPQEERSLHGQLEGGNMSPVVSPCFLKTGARILTSVYHINPLNPELNLIWYLLALLAHHFLHVSRIRVKLLNFRRLMSYIYVTLVA